MILLCNYSNSITQVVYITHSLHVPNVCFACYKIDIDLPLLFINRCCIHYDELLTYDHYHLSVDISTIHMWSLLLKIDCRPLTFEWFNIDRWLLALFITMFRRSCFLLFAKISPAASCCKRYSVNSTIIFYTKFYLVLDVHFVLFWTLLWVLLLDR
jgi:hypothetical protein